jgi:hypothetical protein
MPLMKELQAANFIVTALTRPDSTFSFPEGVRVIPVDYTSVSALTEAISGQDVVISVLGPYGLPLQSNLVKAAAKAGVRRFIPAEFGADLLNPRCRAFPVHGLKVDVQELLKQKFTQTGMTYTLIFTGPFLDWGLRNGFILNLKEHTATLYDQGLHTFSATTLHTIVKAIVASLQHLKETENRGVYIQDAAVSQTMLVDIAKKVDGKEWQLAYADTADLEKAAMQAFARQDPDMMSMAGAVFRAHFGGEQFGMPFKNLDNDLLGIELMTGADLERMVRDIIEEC